ncbi:MAG TPA: PAS domain S-box protein, partial [Chitinophagales bacterium]|nr:PAS domain S-box protein [Chitinophagales bacterium]
NGKREIFYANFTYQPLYDSTQKINGIISIAVDVTQQVAARKKIQESEERFRSLAEALPQLTWVTDEKGIAEFTSSRWKEYSGIEPAGEREWNAIVHPDDYDRINDAWTHSLNTGVFYRVDVRLLSKDGNYRWHTVNGEPVFDKEHKLVKWVGAFTDTHVEKTFSRELEEKVIARTAELKASEEKFYTLFNLSPICKTLSDTETGKIVMVNDAFSKLFGYTREETLGKSSAELGLLDPEVRKMMIEELQANGKILSKELWFIKKSGERFIALTSAEVISMGGKQFFLSAFSDISDIKKAEQSIKQKNMELEKMNKELQSFAYISSHDLQEPLRKIQTFATRIKEKEENSLSDYGKEMFNRMQDSARRMQILIQDLLAYSRTSTQERKFENTDLNKIIAEVKEDLKEELKEKHATIEANNLCNAEIIPFQFRQLMHNLIGNSLKFSSPENPPCIQIKSEIVSGIKSGNERVSPQNKYCHITVSDNGIGFEQQYNEKIFEVFQRLHG